MASFLNKSKKNLVKINQLEKEFESLKDSDFSAKTSILKMRLKAGESLDKLLPEAFALVREVAKRTLGMRAFDAQLMGAMAIHGENITEMKTGEGKTLTIVFSAYLGALSGKGVHVVTANDYLAKRDADWMSRIYKILGLGVGSIIESSGDFDRQVAYSSDITYISNNELGFDFLKDNMIFNPANRRQRELHYAIVDEADSVLMDEAQTPLVISDKKNSSDEDKKIFVKINPLIKNLTRDIDFTLDIKSETINLTIEGIKKLEKLLGVDNLYDNEKTDYLFFVSQLLKAHYLFKKDRDYTINDGKAVIVDEFTGRLMVSHRYFQGIHQAIEAKENLQIQDETETQAAITFQHFFRRYERLAGVTGTGKTSEREFLLIYGKPVVRIPTNREIIRVDMPDRFFARWEDKIGYLDWVTQSNYFNKRATLIGTRSIKKSNEIHLALLASNIPSSVLNAKHTSREAEVIAEAGQPQTVTVATNMAGRGTDIELAEKVKESGGLVIFGTERHNARRIDEQLIGRSGRQGDPGQTQFLISADDELIKTYYKRDYLKIISSEKEISQGVENNQALSKLLKKAQDRMEGIFFEQRILNYQFDRVLEKQRTSFYRQRNRVLNDADLKEETLSLIDKELLKIIGKNHTPKSGLIFADQASAIKISLEKLVINAWFKCPIEQGKNYSIAEIRDLCRKSLADYYNDFENYVSSKKMRMIEKISTLKVLDLIWIDFLKKTESLQEGALINSISKADFFEDYEIKMDAFYRSVLLSAPKAIVMTIFRSMNRILAEGGKLSKK